MSDDRRLAVWALNGEVFAKGWRDMTRKDYLQLARIQVREARCDFKRLEYALMWPRWRGHRQEIVLNALTHLCDALHYRALARSCAS